MGSMRKKLTFMGARVFFNWVDHTFSQNELLTRTAIGLCGSEMGRQPAHGNDILNCHELVVAHDVRGCRNFKQDLGAVSDVRPRTAAKGAARI